MTKTFNELGLSPQILKAVEAKGFTTPSPIQAGVIPLLLNGNRDIIGQAQTGTGKTAAFALPLLERLNASEKTTQAIVLAPTRELAVQVAKEIQSFQVENSPSVAVVYGGNPIRDEIAKLRRSPNIVIGTPGRMQHHIRNNHLKMDNIKYFVLDEADEMLSFGFRAEIEEMLKMTPPQRRVLLFSATMPQSIMRIVDNYMGDHDTVKVASNEMTNKNITQKYYCVRQGDRFEALCRIMEDEETFYAIVFCRTKSDTDFVASQLAAKHLRAEAIHGDIDQSKREKILGRFRANKTNILVATDVAARGIDISELNFVVNYGLPENYEVYTHRIGRTGRAGNKGTSITFVTGSEISRLRYFEKNLGVRMEKGAFPNPQNIVDKKKNHLVERLEHIVNNEDINHLLPLAQQLLEEGKPVEIMAALLKDSYKGDFNLDSYKTIREDVERSGGGGGSFRNRNAGGRRRSGGGGYKGGGRSSSGGGYKGGGRSSSGGYKGGNSSSSGGGYQGSKPRSGSSSDGGGYKGGGRNSNFAKKKSGDFGKSSFGKKKTYGKKY